MTTPGDSRSKYEQVAASLRLAITQGDLDHESPLPSEAELRERYGVSRDTVRRAVALLTQEGLITSGQGKARRIRSDVPFKLRMSYFESKERRDDEMYDAWAAEVIDQGRQPSETIEFVGIVTPPTEIAQRLKLDQEPGYAVVRRRVRFVDGQPYQLADSYFPENLARGTILMEPQSVARPGGVLKDLKHTLIKLVDEIRIRMPTADEASRLGLPAATPVAEIIRTGIGVDEKPLRVMVTVAPGDRTILEYEVTTGDA